MHAAASNLPLAVFEDWPQPYLILKSQATNSINYTFNKCTCTCIDENELHALTYGEYSYIRKQSILRSNCIEVACVHHEEINRSKQRTSSTNSTGRIKLLFYSAITTRTVNM